MRGEHEPSLLDLLLMNKEGIVSDLEIQSLLGKNGNRPTPSNYQPISLTCIASKVIESFIRDHMLQRMKANDLLTRKQFGFLQGRSTVLQLLRVLDDWTDSLDQGIGVDAIYLDFHKAFDKVPHK